MKYIAVQFRKYVKKPGFSGEKTTKERDIWGKREKRGL